MYRVYQEFKKKNIVFSYRILKNNLIMIFNLGIIRVYGKLYYSKGAVKYFIIYTSNNIYHYTINCVKKKKKSILIPKYKKICFLSFVYYNKYF